MSRLINPTDCTLLVVDVQQRLVANLPDAETFVHRVVCLAAGCRATGVPVLATEQVPAKLGATDPRIGVSDAIPKTRFSAWSPEVAGRCGRDVIVCGMETHVCVMQTCIDAIDAGHRAWLVGDAVAAVDPARDAAARRRMAAAGAVESDVVGVLYELLRDATHPAFGEVLKLVKTLG